MFQLHLFDCAKPINVASVPMRSPFRYAGGKTWFVPYIRVWLAQFRGNVTLVDPFAGGGIISLTAAFENLVRKVIMVEKDEDIAAVWKTILGRQGKWLAQQILDMELEKEKVEAILKYKPKIMRERALVTILRNRLCHGGILAYGAGLIKNGENGKGLFSRWYPSTLYNRIMNIINIKDKFIFIEGDGLEIIEQNMKRKNMVFFIDPPYTMAGRRLYKYHEIDYDKLFCLAEKIQGDFLMTFDDSCEIKQTAYNKNFEVEKVLMKTTHHEKKYELVIGRNLAWLRKVLTTNENRNSIRISQLSTGNVNLKKSSEKFPAIFPRRLVRS